MKWHLTNLKQSKGLILGGKGLGVGARAPLAIVVTRASPVLQGHAGYHPPGLRSLQALSLPLLCVFPPEVIRDDSGGTWALPGPSSGLDRGTANIPPIVHSHSLQDTNPGERKRQCHKPAVAKSPCDGMATSAWLGQGLTPTITVENLDESTPKTKQISSLTPPRDYMEQIPAEG